MSLLMLMSSNKWLFFASFFSALNVIIIKYYEKVMSNWLLLVALLSQSGLIYSYVQLLKDNDILAQFALVKIISILIILLPSILFFGSVLTTKKIFGLLFSIIAIYLLNT